MDSYLHLNSWPIYGLSVTIVFWLIYKHLTKNFDYFKTLGLKGPKPVVIFGNLLDYLFVSKPDREVQRMKQFGKIHGIFEGNKPFIQVSDPEIIKQILVKDFRLFNNKPRIIQKGNRVIDQMLLTSKGDTWRRARTAVSPAFTTARMRKQYPHVRHCVREHLLPVLQTHADSRTACDLKWVYSCFALSAINRCAFGVPTDPYRDFQHPLVANAWPVFRLPVWKMYALQVLPTSLLRKFNIDSFFNETCIENIARTIRQIIRAKASAGDNGDDFISAVMHSKPDVYDDQDVDSLVMGDKTDGTNGVKEPLTEDEVVAQGFNMYTAGFDQMANLLAFVSYELALKPEAQERLYAEIVAAGAQSDGEIGYDELRRLPYMEAVVNETLRLHATPVKLRRTPGVDFPLTGTRIVVRKGQPLEMPIYANHHSDEYFPDAERFIPDRFLQENRHNIKPYTFLPFSAGPRVCVGQPFVLLETKLALFHVLRRFRFAVHKDTKVPPIVKTHPMIKGLVSLYLSVVARD